VNPRSCSKATPLVSIAHRYTFHVAAKVRESDFALLLLGREAAPNMLTRIACLPTHRWFGCEQVAG
jgi:hypothetical protein